MFTPDILEFFDQLKKHKISYSLGGSGMLVALGLLPKEKQRDWDILSDVNKERVIEIFPEAKVYPTKDPFASKYLLKFNYKSANIDWIGSFAIYDEQHILHRFSSQAHCYYQDIPISNPRDWLKVYELLGRHEKVAILQKYLHGLKNS